MPVIGDVELFARALDALPQGQRPRVVAITGTNGKSTTTALIGWVLKSAGLSVHIGGNIGIGVLALPEPTPDAVYVIEVSSYQLDLTTSFAPDVAILTNISPDHLDRHGGMEGYVAAKARLFQAHGEGRTAIVGIDEHWGKDIFDAFAARRLDHHGYDPGRDGRRRASWWNTGGSGRGTAARGSFAALQGWPSAYNGGDGR